jgi:hypothetical protein
MSQTKDVEKVKSALETFFKGLDDHDDTIVRQIWHPDARLFLNNAVLSTRPLSFLLGLPKFIDFKIREIKHIDVHQAIATARVDYLMPVGLHSGFFNLVKVQGQWLIANWVDHGTTTKHHKN